MPWGAGKFRVNQIDWHKNIDLKVRASRRQILDTDTVVFKKKTAGTSLAFQWLRLCASTTEAEGSIPGWETKIPHAAWSSQKIKGKDYLRGI